MTVDLDDPAVLLDPAVLDDPGPFLDELRRTAPVWQVPGQDTFVVSDPALVRDAVGRPEDFSSNLVEALHAGGDGCPVRFGLGRHGDPMYVLATADPPRHTVHRRLLQGPLSASSVAELEPTLTAIVDRRLDDLLAGSGSDGAVDAVRTFTDPVPADTICEVIGLPAEDAAFVVDIVADVGALLDGVTDRAGIDRAATRALELTAYAETHLRAATAAAPSERRGLLGLLATAVDDGEITHDEARDILVILVSAGSETTASLLATMVDLLAGDPELQSRLRNDPALVPDAIEQALRTDGPFQFHYRWTPGDTTLGGSTIPAGSVLLLMWSAANRAVEESGSADGRTPPHFAFGRGLHFCIGAPLARLETRIAVERLLARTEGLSLDPDRPPSRRPSIFIRRHATLPVVVRPA